MTRYLVRLCALAAVVALAGCGRGVQLDQVPEDTETRLVEECDVDVAAWLDKLARNWRSWPTNTTTPPAGGAARASRNQAEEDLPLPRPVASRRRRRLPQGEHDDSSASVCPSTSAAKSPTRRSPSTSPASATTTPPSSWPATTPRCQPGNRRLREREELSRRMVPPREPGPDRRPEQGRHRRRPGRPSEVVCIHRQLVKILDGKAAASPLASALLPAGRRAIARAAEAYRGPRQNKTALAADLDGRPRRLGDRRRPSPLGTTKSQAEAIFATQAKGGRRLPPTSTGAATCSRAAAADRGRPRRHRLPRRGRPRRRDQRRLPRQLRDHLPRGGPPRLPPRRRGHRRQGGGQHPRPAEGHLRRERPLRSPAPTATSA